MNDETNPWHLSDKWYNRFRLLVVLVLPAIAALYTGLGALWGWPLITEVVGTISLITVFFATILGISRSGYQKSQSQ